MLTRRGVSSKQALCNNPTAAPRKRKWPCSRNSPLLLSLVPLCWSHVSLGKWWSTVYSCLWGNVVLDQLHWRPSPASPVHSSSSPSASCWKPSAWGTKDRLCPWVCCPCHCLLVTSMLSLMKEGRCSGMCKLSVLPGSLIMWRLRRCNLMPTMLQVCCPSYSYQRWKWRKCHQLLAACEGAQAADPLQWWKSLEVSFQPGLLYLRKFSLSSLALLLLKECFLCWKTLLERTRPLPWRIMLKAPWCCSTTTPEWKAD